MTTPNPPAVGDTGWGTELNNYLLNTLKAEADGTSAALAAHVAGAPSTATGSDPHGDRAFAQQLLAPFLTNLNSPSGLVQLDSTGKIPSSLIPAAAAPAGSFSLLESTGVNGFALQNGTPTILSWNVPGDGALHRVLLIADLNITSVLTGGGIQVTYTSPAGTSTTKTVFTQTAIGEYAASPLAFLVSAGSTVTITQTSAITAGAATLWAEIWGS